MLYTLDSTRGLNQIWKYSQNTVAIHSISISFSFFCPFCNFSFYFITFYMIYYITHMQAFCFHSILNNVMLLLWNKNASTIFFIRIFNLWITHSDGRQSINNWFTHIDMNVISNMEWWFLNDNLWTTCTSWIIHITFNIEDKHYIVYIHHHQKNNNFNLRGISCECSFCWAENSAVWKRVINDIRFKNI